MTENSKSEDMDTLKKLLSFTIVTIVIIFLLLWSLDAFGFRSPIFAFLVNWLVMSWVAFNGQVIHLSFTLRYYALKPFEQTGRVYERLGIRLFKRLVRRGPLAMFSPTLRFPKDKTVPALRILENEMRKAEAGHALIFVIMLLFVGYALLQGWVDATAWLLLFNILINGYPIMLQRYNRIKLQELILQQETGFIEGKETRGIGGRAA